MSQDEETVGLPMMLSELGFAIGRGDLNVANLLQQLAIDWAMKPENRSDIYLQFGKTAGWAAQPCTQ